jgi:magnesium chelatase subunit H
MMSFQYWLGGSPENLEAMLLMMANNYVYEGQKQIEAEKIAEAHDSQKFSMQ